LFFQAEDGIRDRNVTGVQTCALPISWTPTFWSSSASARKSAADDLPLRISSRMRSKTRTLESTPMPMVRMTPAMPGRVSTAPDKIGRASGRERGEMGGVEGAGEKKEI